MASFEELGIKVKGNGQFTTTCPQCSHTRKPENKNKPCLTVNNVVGNRWWSCNHPTCGFKGNLDVMEKYDKIYKESGMPKEKPKFYSQGVLEFIGSKGLQVETFIKANVYEPLKDGKSGKRPIIAYPYYFKRGLRNVMFRLTDHKKGIDNTPREWQIKKEHGTETIFWGLDELDLTHSEIIIVEGQTDRLTWLECGYKNVLSIPMGGINKETKNLDKKLEFLNEEFFEYIKPMMTDLELSKTFRFCLCMDNDEVGENTTEILASRLGKENCYQPRYPKGYKDSNEIYAGNLEKNLYAKRKQGIQDLYLSFKPFKISGIIRVHEIREDIINYGKKGLEKGLITGKEHYDRLWSIKSKLLMGVTGIPKMGKTVEVRDYLVNLNKYNPGMRWALYSPEQRGGKNDVEREYVAMAENYAGGKFSDKYKSSLSNTQIERALDWVGDTFFMVNPKRNNFTSFGKDDSNPATMQNLFDYFLYLKKTEGIFGFVIDAWNRVEHIKQKGEADEAFVGRELNRLLDFLKTYDLACIIVAHPTKMDKLDGKNYDHPQMYNIKGSSAWMERLDIGVSVHRPNLYVNRNADTRGASPAWDRDNNAHTEIELQILKFQELGEPGKSVVSLDWSKGERFVPVKEVKVEKPVEESKPKNGKKVKLEVPVEVIPQDEEPIDDLPF